MGERGLWDGHRYDDVAWRSLATGPTGVRRGYASIRRDERGFPIFIAATGLSDGSLRIQGEESVEQTLSEPGSPLSKQLCEPSERKGDAESRARPASIDSAEESMATLYARLAASLSAEQSATRRQNTYRDDLLTTQRPHRSGASNRQTSAPDWFIRRAVQRQTQQRNANEANPPAVLADKAATISSRPLRCASCQAVVLSGSDPNTMAAHQASIAHQLAVSSSESPALGMRSKVALRHTADAAQPYKDSTIVLKSSNIGYMALERMGWRAGMGLGRDEWEVARSEAMSRSDEASYLLEERVSPTEKIIESSNEEGASTVDRNELDSDGEDQELDDGNESTLVPIDGAISDTAKEAPQATFKRRADVFLEPVPLHVRPDRRGIGVKLPASARVRDRPRHVEVTKPSAQPKSEHHRTKKLSRTAQYKRDRSEWLALRASLND